MKIRLLAIVWLALWTCGAAAAPNLVVVISDDHGSSDSEVAGATRVRTPNLRRLAEAGVTVSSAFAASPSCAPSRAALLTGLMPARNGSMQNHQPPRAEVKKLPAYFQELGYEVVAIGKVAHYAQTRTYGFDHVSHETFHDDRTTTAAVEYLRQRKSAKPLCLLVGTNWPHVPWPKAGRSPAADAALSLPPTHVDTPETRRWRRRYYAAVEKMDSDLGRVYDEAYQRLGDDTLLIHFSDHGAQWPFGKWNLYDAGIRVPFFAAWPGKIAPGSETSAMISLVDVLPTLIEAAGGTPPTDLDGTSRLAALIGSGAGASAVFATHSGDGKMNQHPQRCVRTARWKYIRNLRPQREHHTHIDRGQAVDGNGYWPSWVAAAASDERARAIVERYFHRPAEELYDLESDPFEERNLAGDGQHTAELDRLRAELDAWMKRQGDAGLATEEAVAAAFLAK